MKLYDDTLAPNPRRVRIFLAEKGISVPLVQVEIIKGEHKTPEMRALNPAGTWPLLELDDGTRLTETVAICRYFELIQPDPPLMGRTPLEAAQVEMWQRRMEFELFMPIALSFRHLAPPMAKLETQIKDFGLVNKARAEKRLERLNDELAAKPFIAGDSYSIADITAMCAIDFGKYARIPVDDSLTHVKDWYARVSTRPSAKA